MRRSLAKARSQASSAGHGEKDVRRKIVETGDVDLMIAIRSNFFYTRTVPCELWFLNRNKPKSHRNKVLMLDARNIYRKVTRKIYDFSPEQMQNLSAIVWLYRGQQARFLALVRDYLRQVCVESAAIPPVFTTFEATLADLRRIVEASPVDSVFIALPAEAYAMYNERFWGRSASHRLAIAAK